MTRASGQKRSHRVSALQVLLQLVPGALLAALFVAVGLLHVTSRVLVVDTGYRLSRLQEENRQLTLRNDRLKLELATLLSPARLERLAKEQLRLQPPPAGTVIPLSGAAQVPPAAGGAPRPPAMARAGPR
ncbi:MAG TPA: cell division protein FtsL [Myxococcaceae bacterium]|jgi:cell division protein FtsL